MIARAAGSKNLVSPYPYFSNGREADTPVPTSARQLFHRKSCFGLNGEAENPEGVEAATTFERAIYKRGQAAPDDPSIVGKWVSVWHQRFSRAEQGLAREGTDASLQDAWLSRETLPIPVFTFPVE
jgi:hypothetical protein